MIEYVVNFYILQSKYYIHKQTFAKMHAKMQSIFIRNGCFEKESNAN